MCLLVPQSNSKYPQGATMNLLVANKLQRCAASVTDKQQILYIFVYYDVSL